MLLILHLWSLWTAGTGWFVKVGTGLTKYKADDLDKESINMDIQYVPQVCLFVYDLSDICMAND